MALSDGDSVRSWINRVDGNPVVATGSERPTYETNEINGHDVIRFDGTDDVLAEGVPDMMDPNGLAGLTVIVVGSVDDLTGFYPFVSRNENSSGRGFLLLYDHTSNNVAFGVANSASVNGARRTTADLVATQRYIITGVYDGTGGTIDTYLDGTLDNGTQTGTIPATIFQSGDIFRIGNTGDSGVDFDGDIAEILIYNRALTSGELTSVHNALSTKYSI